MPDRLIGKNVEIVVTFAMALNNVGLAPIAYYGILKAVDEEYCVLSLRYMKPVIAVSKIFNSDLGENCAGDIYIRKEYIVTCRELQQ